VDLKFVEMFCILIAGYFQFVPPTLTKLSVYGENQPLSLRSLMWRICKVSEFSSLSNKQQTRICFETKPAITQQSTTKFFGLMWCTLKEEGSARIDLPVAEIKS
jgi:hypothetical protein